MTEAESKQKTKKMMIRAAIFFGTSFVVASIFMPWNYFKLLVAMEAMVLVGLVGPMWVAGEV